MTSPTASAKRSCRTFGILGISRIWVIIGERVRVIDSYVGPFTSISEGVEIIKSEIECSVVLEESKLEYIKGRMQRCLIGKGVEIYHFKDLPRVYEFILGDHSKVGLL